MVHYLVLRLGLLHNLVLVMLDQMPIPILWRNRPFLTFYQLLSLAIIECSFVLGIIMQVFIGLSGRLKDLILLELSVLLLIVGDRISMLLRFEIIWSAYRRICIQTSLKVMNIVAISVLHLRDFVLALSLLWLIKLSKYPLFRVHVLTFAVISFHLVFFLMSPQLFWVWLRAWRLNFV